VTRTYRCQNERQPILERRHGCALGRRKPNRHWRCCWLCVGLRRRALSRPVSVFRAAHVSKCGWVAGFAVLAVLMVSSDIGVRLIHAPYHLRTVNSLLLVATTGCALACTCLYLMMVGLAHRSSPHG
jgi:hypothetical protein